MAETSVPGALVKQQLPVRDRIVVLSGLTAAATLAWIYLLYMSWGMEHMEAAAAMVIMPRMTNWGTIDLLLVLAMWVIMMTAMMLPSVMPMILSFAFLSRRRRAHRAPYGHTAVFVLGYLAVWFCFSLLATFAQWGLLEGRLLTPMMVSATPLFGGACLIMAGVFQFTPLKQTCLGKCGSPLGFLLNEWREGAFGAWVMGLRHGTYCLGCCWALMASLFVFGVMNVFWIAVLSIYVLLEKIIPRPRWLTFAQGLALVGWGIAVAAGV